MATSSLLTWMNQPMEFIVGKVIVRVKGCQYWFFYSKICQKKFARGSKKCSQHIKEC